MSHLSPENPVPHFPEEAKGLVVRFEGGIARFSSRVGLIGDHLATASLWTMMLAIHPRDVVNALRTEGLSAFPKGYRSTFEGMQPILHLKKHPNYPNF